MGGLAPKVSMGWKACLAEKAQMGGLAQMVEMGCLACLAEMAG
jgi:hypothetical protein